ncbi:MAG: FKBP-type peptidyl-prolyl cis-trans isomerase [Candidatus Hydrogenedentes bacterium]|nr:FKBP-type peptidyl-prolyl cis-trans isomerase [Candidatus Hydrogenedentota bacterium]
MSTLKSILFYLTVFAMLSVPVLVHGEEGKELKLESDIDKLCYTLGVNVAKTFELIGQKPNLDVFVKAINDVLEKKKLAMTDEEMQNSIRSFQQNLVNAQMKRREEQATKNEEEAKKFLEENKHKEGIVTHPSGIQYKVLKEGDGPKPKETDTVKVHYKGTLLDGTVFDSSYDRGEPVNLPLNRVIKGWSEAVQLMSVGSKWQIFIPPDLAYGKEGNQVIPPNSLLIFEVELLGIENQGQGGDTVELPKEQ